MNGLVRTRAFSGAMLLLALLAVARFASAERATSLDQARTLYVEPFDGGGEAAALRDGLIRRLERDHRFRMVPSAEGADAVVKGTGKIWIRGYISSSGRTPVNGRQAVYAGYLSLEVVGVEDQPLWSWLVTPGKFAWKNTVDDMVDRAAARLLAAAQAASAAAAGPGPAGHLAQTNLIGGGATFPAPLYQKWFEDFEELHPGVHIRYDLLGSQLGTEKLAAGKLDFAGADVAPELLSSAASVSSLRRVASVLGAVVAIYNLNGSVRDLHFTPEALAGIYLGRIHRWNDPEIRRSNKGIALPDAEIVVVHRSDGSGTTWVWSDYLSKVSPAWAGAVSRGATLHWPVGIGAEGNDGVAATVQKTPYSIGYVELAYAIQRQLTFAAVRNRSGVFVHADLDSLAEAARSSGSSSDPPTDITDPPGRNAYPIASFTWLLIPSAAADSAKKAALLELLRWVLTSGQKECSALGYSPLPRSIAESQLRALSATP